MPEGRLVTRPPRMLGAVARRLLWICVLALGAAALVSPSAPVVALAMELAR